MPARRFFIEGTHACGDRVAIAGSDAHKIRNVLRLKSGDAIETVDSGGSVFSAAVEIDGVSVHAMLATMTTRMQPTRRIDVAQGLPKAQKMDFVVEKATELGASAIVPFVSERAVVRDAPPAKLDRWRRLARAAAQQSGRTNVPDVSNALDFDQLLERFALYDLVLFPWEAASPGSLHGTLRERLPAADRVLMVIGPEGGFSHDEAERAAAAGAVVVSLGTRILRTETAALALLTILIYEGER